MKGYSAENTIIVYRIQRPLLKTLEHLKAQLNFDIYVAQKATDLIAVPCFMQIVNPKKMSSKDMEELSQWFDILTEAYDKKDICILFTSTPNLQIPKKVSKFIIDTLDLMDEDYLKLKILNKRAAVKRHLNQNRRYDRKIFRILKMLLFLKDGGIVKIQDWANEFNVSGKTIIRDIGLINALGELTEYDKGSKGYSIMAS